MEVKIKQYERRFPQVSSLSIKRSDKKSKRFRADFVMQGGHRTVHFGQPGAYTFYDGAPTKKMMAYKARASKIVNKDGQYTYLIPGTANSLAYWILW